MSQGQDLDLCIRISTDGKAAVDGTRQVESGMEKMRETAKTVGAAIAAYLTFDFLKAAAESIFQANAALQAFQAQFESLSGSQRQAAVEMEYVTQTARRMSLDLTAARESYAGLLNLQQSGLVTQRETRQIFEGFANLAPQLGASSEQVKQSMYGLSQGLAAGVLRAEEFNQITEPMPGLLNRMAEAMGVSAGELRKMVNEGEVSSEMLKSGLIKAFEGVEGSAEKMSGTLGAIWQRVKNEWTLLLESFGTADWTSAIEGSSFNDMAASVLTGLEGMVKDAGELLRSGWLVDALAAEVEYAKVYLSDLLGFLDSLADPTLFDDIASNWQAMDLWKNFKTVFTDLPEIVASFTVIAASTIDQWVITLSASWEVVKISFSRAWANMFGWLSQILADMQAAVATAAAKMALSFIQNVSGMAAAVSDIPGVGDVMVGIVEKLGNAREATMSWALAAQQGAADVQAANAATTASYDAKIAAVREAANQQKAASESAAQQTVLEQRARTEARDAAIAQAQAARQASSASTANSAAAAANSAAQAANAAATDKAAKAKKSAADRIAEQSQKLTEEIGGLQRLTQAYLSHNDALVAQTKIENEIAKLDPALRDQARAKAIEELNTAVAQKLYDLKHEAQLLTQEAQATLQGADALALFADQKQLESVLRERNTGALEAETTQIVQQHAAAKQLLDDVKSVMAAYQDSLTPQQKYTEALDEIAKTEARLKDAGQWTTEAAKGIDHLREKAAEAALEADPMATAFSEAAKAIYDGWNGFWEDLFTGGLDSFSDFGEQIKDFFLKLLAQLSAAALAQPVLLPVIQVLGGSLGVGQSAIASVANSLFGAGTMALSGGSSSGSLLSGGSSLLSNLSSGFGLFGGGGVGSLVGGAVGGLGSLIGGSFGAGLQAGGAYMSGMGLLSGGATAASAGLSGTLGAGLSAGMLASAAIPVVGLVIGGLIASGVFSKEAHPSSVAIAGLQTEGSGVHVGYRGKGDWITSSSGMGWGYAYGHTDPADAQELRSGLMQIDEALAQIIPTANMANVALGQYGQNAEGFLAGMENATDSSWRYVESMDEVTAWFVRDWVEAAAAQGAVSQDIARMIQTMTGSAEELMTGLGGLLQVEDFTQANPLADYAAALESAGQSAGSTLDALRAQVAGMAKDFDGSAASAEALGAASVELYQAELAMIDHIQGLISGLSDSFGGSLTSLRESLMSEAEKYTAYTAQAQAAAEALATATDPDEIASLAEEARQAAMSAFDLISQSITDESQRAGITQQFIQFLEETQQTAADRLNAAQQEVVDQHQQTAELLQQALESGAERAASALVSAGETAASAISAAITSLQGLSSSSSSSANEKVASIFMAGGGWVPGTWNGKPGIAGDTTITALTPGEAVIPRAQAQRHARLLKSIMADDVRYAAAGLPTWPETEIPTTETPTDTTTPSRASGNSQGYTTPSRPVRLDLGKDPSSASSEATEAAAAFNRELQQFIESFGLAEDALASLELDRWLEEMVAKAEETGGSLALVEEVYGLKRVALAEQQAQSIIAAYEELSSAITSARQAGASAMLNIRRQQSGWSESAYQASEVSRLRDQLGTAGTATEKISVIQQLQSAITARYDAEAARISAVQSQSQSFYDSTASALNRTAQIIERINEYLDSLMLSNLSPLTPTARLDEAQSQYQAMLAKARSGDAEAGDAITSMADSYLKEARSYYASSDDYSQIFGDVYAELEGLRGVRFRSDSPATGSASSSSSYYASASASASLGAAQQAALAQLAELDDMLKTLQDEADKDLATQLDAWREGISDSSAETVAAIEASGHKSSAEIVAAVAKLQAELEAALERTGTAQADATGKIVTAALERIIENMLLAQATAPDLSLVA